MAFDEPYSDTGTTISTTEWSLTNDSSSIATQTTQCVMQAVIKIASIAAGDEFLVKVYDKVYSGGSQEVIYSKLLAGAQPGPFVTPPLQLMHGWDVTLDKIAGTDRTASWSIRTVT
jgi:hypothetical protein